MHAQRACWLLGALLSATAQAGPAAPPPVLDCAKGFEALRAEAMFLPGGEKSEENGFEVVHLAVPAAWRVDMRFTTNWHPAHPAASLRTFRKQVTGVWTAESQSCGYGNQQAFLALVDEMKAGDKALTDASRAEVEADKASRSPLAPPP